MNRIEVERHDWKPPPPEEGRRFSYAGPPPPDATIIEGEAILTDRDGRLVVASGTLDGKAIHSGSLLAMLPETNWTSLSKTSSNRLRGFINAMRTFGVTGPQPVRQRFGCSYCRFNTDYPVATEYLRDVGRELWALFQRVAPVEAAEQQALVEPLIHPDWLWAGTPWTSGVINETSALPYHRDSDNVPGSWSAQLNLRRNVDGGLLHLPEYGVYLACESRSALIFPGQGIWHGVTPVAPTAPRRTHRYSIVLYTKYGIRHCGPAADETRRAQRVRTTYEVART